MAATADDKRLYKIGEVCKLADVQPYVLRYWETEFPSLAPNKSGGGQRMYSRHEIDIILRIKKLLYAEGFTIAGAKKKLDVEPADTVDVSGAGIVPVPQLESRAALAAADLRAGVIDNVRAELAAILKLLRD